jgi:hypothetical protein
MIYAVLGLMPGKLGSIIRHFGKARLTVTKAGARGFLQACFAMAALLLFAAAGLRAETLDQLYEKAKLDKALAFYADEPAAPAENRAKEFMQKYAAIAVSVMGGFSNALNEQIEKQMADRKLDRLSSATVVVLLCLATAEALR